MGISSFVVTTTSCTFKSGVFGNTFGMGVLVCVLSGVGTLRVVCNKGLVSDSSLKTKTLVNCFLVLFT